MGPIGPPKCYKPVAGTCPPGQPGSICAHPDTPIATPFGDRAIASLRPGDLVYSEHDRAIVAVPIERVSRTAVRHHEIVRVRLDNGAELRISPRHPTADGRLFSDLSAGDDLGGAKVLQVDHIAYEASHTYDILPSSDSGHYIAGGAIIGSTLRGGPF
jgi:hypothetical protein